MPERFLFFALTGLDRAAIRCAGTEMDIIVLLDNSEPTLASLGPDHLLLNCTPAVNLFPKRADRVNLDGTRDEHLVVPDRMRPLDYEVFSIGAVEGFPADRAARPSPSCRSTQPTTSAGTLATAATTCSGGSRTCSAHGRDSGVRGPATWGTTCSWSLVDADNQRTPHLLRQLGVDLLCTNRDLALSMPVGKQHTDFTVVVNAPVASVRCLVGPDRAAALPPGRGLGLALHLPPGAELPDPDGHGTPCRAPRPCGNCCACTCRPTTPAPPGNWRGCCP